LEVHGLDKCLDHGIDAFERYVGLAVLSRNIQKLGTIKRDMERLRLFNEQQKKLAAWRFFDSSCKVIQREGAPTICDLQE